MSRLKHFFPPRGLAVLLVMLTVSGLPACSSDITPEEYIARAKNYQDTGENSAAIIELKNALRQSPSNTEARWLLGRLYLKLGAGAAAEKELRRAIEFGVVPESAAIPLTRALLIQRKYQEIIDSKFNTSGFSDADRGELLALRASAYLRSGKPEKANEFYNKALSIKPDNAEARTGRAMLAVARNQRDAARKELATVFETTPEFGPAWSLLGLIEFWEENPKAAEEAYTKAMQDPLLKNPSQMSRALIRIRLKEFDQAAEDIRAVRKRFGKQPPPEVDYADGLLHFNQGSYAEARDLFDQVLSRIPNHQPALFYAGATNLILGNPSSAIAHLGHHLALNPNNEMARKLMAQAELESDNPDKAEKLTLAALKQAPDDMFTMNLLADSLVGLGKQDQAVEYLKRMVAARPESPGVRARLGGVLETLGDQNQSLIELKKALQLDPQLHQAAEGIVRQYLRAGELDKALEAAREHRDRQPDAVPAYMLLGLVHVARKEVEAASESFQRALKIEPGNVPAYSGLAIIAIQEKQLDRAEGYYLEALKHHPNDLNTQINLSKLKAMQGDQDAAKSLLSEAIESNPEALEPRLLLGRSYLQAGEPDKARDTVRDVLSAYPQSKNLLGLLAESELALGQYAEARSTLMHLTELAPGDPRVQLYLSQAYEGLNDRGNMRKALERAAALAPDFVPAQIGLARLAIREKRIDDAESRIAGLKKRIDGDSPIFLLTEAQLAELKDDLPAAQNAYRKLFDLEPSSGNLRRLSRSQWNAGDKASALQTLQQWVKKHPKDTRTELELAQRYLMLQRTQDAIASYESVLEVAPDDALALNNLASLLIDSDPQTSLGYAERVYALFPRDPSAMDTLAGALLSTGDTKRAARMIERALGQQPDNPSFLYRRAQILEANGQKSEAIEVLNEILRPGRAFPERPKTEAMLARLKTGS